MSERARAMPQEARQLRHNVNRSVGQSLGSDVVAEMETRRWPVPPVAGSRFDLTAYHALERSADAAVTQRSGEGELETNLKQAGARVDFSGVRLHSDGAARAATEQLGARAFTIGQHIYANPSLMNVDRRTPNATLIHELAHVAQQQRIGRAFIQPQLIATGSDADVHRFMSLAQAGMGEMLTRDPVTHAITANGSLAQPARSPAFASSMHTIMDDASQNAEAHFGTHQTDVVVGAFPQPDDMTGPTEQRIDMDDIEAIEHGAPGNGLAKLAHELNENYAAHAETPRAGVNQFTVSHQLAIAEESDVAE